MVPTKSQKLRAAPHIIGKLQSQLLLRKNMVF